jgi:hypothetical protein
MKRIRTSAPRRRSDRSWPENLPDDPRDPDVVRAKTLARSRLIPDQPGALAANKARPRRSPSIPEEACHEEPDGA